MQPDDSEGEAGGRRPQLKGSSPLDYEEGYEDPFLQQIPGLSPSSTHPATREGEGVYRTEMATRAQASKASPDRLIVVALRK